MTMVGRGSAAAGAAQRGDPAAAVEPTRAAAVRAGHLRGSGSVERVDELEVDEAVAAAALRTTVTTRTAAARTGQRRIARAPPAGAAGAAATNLPMATWDLYGVAWPRCLRLHRRRVCVCM